MDPLISCGLTFASPWPRDAWRRAMKIRILVAAFVAELLAGL